VPDPRDGGVGAVVVNLAATEATGPGNIGIAPHDPAGGQPPNVSFLNFGPIAGLGALANMVIIPVCTTGCGQGEDMDLLARVSNVHLVGDLVGYFNAAQTTVAGAATLAGPALECSASFTYQPVAPHTGFRLFSPACAVDETLTASFYEFLDLTGAPLLQAAGIMINRFIPDPEGSKAMLCQGMNQSDLMVQVGCGANCCGILGN
jgi:hypothetical protein